MSQRESLDEQRRGLSPGANSARVPPVLRVLNRSDAPLSFGQERLWFLQQFEPDQNVYNRPVNLQLSGPLNVAALERALVEIVQRHEILRTCFPTLDGCSVQRVIPDAKPRLAFTDLRGISPDELHATTRQLVAAEAARPFELATSIPVRAHLVQTAEQEYLLLVTVHHIAFDGWSEGVFHRELVVLYEAFSNDRPSPLPELRIQYVDYAVWQREWLQRDVLERQMTYWKQQLAGVPAVLELPTDFPRPAQLSYRGSRQELTLSAELTRKLQELSRREGVTLFMTLLAAFQVLLARYSGQDKVSVGAPIAGRNRTELEGLIGFFVNTLVLLTDLSGNPTFRELLARVRKITLGAFTHQQLPFEKLVEELHPERNLSHSPLFQVMFVLQNAPRSSLAMRDIVMSPLPKEGTTAKFDLTLLLSPQDDTLRGALEYRTDLFEATTIARLAGHYRTLLEGIVADSTTRIRQLPLLTDAERQQVLVEWNDTKVEYPRDKCVHQLFEEQVEHTPGAIAAVFAGQELSYRELNERANQLAHHLRELGVGPETLVALCLERSAELVVGILGILKAGGAYLPLDADYPPQWLQFMLRDAKLEFLVTQRRLLGRFPATGCQVVCLDTDVKQLHQMARSNPSPNIGPDSPVYVMFTSGSTGQPKGVVIRHTSIARLVFGNHYATFGPDRVFLQLAPVLFDASTFELWGALLHGAKLVVAPPGLLDFRQLEDVLKQNRVTTLWLTAALFNQVVEQRPQALNSVEEILTGGEALSVRHICKAQRVFGSRVRLINGYGPTESTTFATCYRIPSHITPDVESIPIGRPIANTAAYVLDAQRQPVPIGVPGELYLGGAGLAQGYLNRPELTRERFVVNPFSEDPDSRLYRTGDVCRWRADGNLEFLGRVDNQVKLRGYRIELGAIEGVLKEHPQVQETVVVLHQDAATGDKTLVAYVVPRGQTPALPDLRGFVQQKLPGYMIPAAFVFLERLPLTANSKIDRQALPAPDVTRRDLAKGYVAPCNALEERLTMIWAELLGLQRIGIHDNFFELGGHSLLAVRLLAAVERTFRVRLPLVTVFQHPTIAQLEALIREPRPELARPVLELLRPGPPDQPPLVIAPSLFGEIHEWRKVPQRLPAGRAIYGLRVAGSEPYWMGCQTLEDVARGFVATLMDRGWTEPCHLAGFSFGGILAFEVARQLAAAGAQVGSVVVVDTGVPLGHRHFARRLVRDLPSMVRNFPRWVWMDVVQSPRRFAERARLKLRSRLTRLRRFIQGKGDGAPRGDPRLAGVFDVDSLPELYRERLSVSWQMVQQYRPGPYRGHLTLLRCRTRPLVHRGNPDLGWRPWVDGRFEIRDLPGNHDTVFLEPYIYTLTDSIHQIISNEDDTRRIRGTST